MKGSILPPKIFVFIVLIFLAGVSWCLAEKSAPSSKAAEAAILIAAIKVRFVFIDFMELKSRTRPWRVLFEFWTFLVTASLTAGYWFSRG